jgi:hypothetical protein
MTIVKAHYNGEVFVPESPVNLPVGYRLDIPIPSQPGKPPRSNRAMLERIEVLDQLPPNPDWPADGAAEHDHYLYGTPKRETVQ